MKQYVARCTVCGPNVAPCYYLRGYAFGVNQKDATRFSSPSAARAAVAETHLGASFKVVRLRRKAVGWTVRWNGRTRLADSYLGSHGCWQVEPYVFRSLSKARSAADGSTYRCIVRVVRKRPSKAEP